MTYIDVNIAAKQTVVIIDDEEEIRTLMELALAKSGRSLVCFADGTAALRYLSAGRHVDIIVSDVRMAGMDGYTLVQRLQQQSETAATPVIFVSANDAADERLAASGAAIEFLRKPFDIADLRARVDAGIARRTAPPLDFHQLLSQAVARARDEGGPVAVMLVATAPPLPDLPAERARGAIASIGAIVRSQLRRSDTAAMLEPFACAAPLAGCPRERAQAIATAIAARLRAERDVLGVDAHVGLGYALGCNSTTVDALLGAAMTAADEAAANEVGFAMRETPS